MAIGGFFSLAPIASAQPTVLPSAQVQPLSPQTQSTVTSTLYNAATNPLGLFNPVGAAVAGNTIGSALGNAAAGQNTDKLGCFVGGNGTNLSLCISNIVYVFTVGLGSSLAYVGAYFFNIAVSLALNSAAYALAFISTGWTVARDLANMGFILALVYLAYTIMLKAETSNTMQMLAWIIFVALIINFSFFFTRLVIDAGNILAVQFYNAIPNTQTLGQTLQQSGASSIPGSGYVTQSTSLQTTKDLTHPIMNGLNMQGLFDNAMFSSASNDWFKNSSFLTVVITLSFLYIAVGAMYLMLAAMFLTAGVKFLVRVVVLWFLIIASPLAFLAKTTTLTTTYYDRWQKLLIAHTFYPVVFLFIFLFIALFMNSLNPGNATGGLIGGLFSDLRQLSASSNIGGISYIAANIANVAIRLGFVIAMLYIGMRIADTVGVMGGSAAAKITGWASGAVRTGLRYGPGWAAGAAYRNTVAAGANAMGKRLAASEKYNTVGTFRGVLGYRLNRNILQPMQKTSLGTVATTFKEREEFLTKRKGEMQGNLDIIKSRNDAQRAAVLNGYAISDIDKDLTEAEKKLKRYDELASHGPTALSPQEVNDRQDTAQKRDGLLRQQDNISRKEGKSWDDLRAEHSVLSKRLENLPNSHVTALKASDIEGIIKQISESHLKAIKESGKYTAQAFDNINLKWHEQNKKAPIAKSKDELEKLEKVHSELGKLGVKIDTVQERSSKTANGDSIITIKTAKDTKEALEERRDEEQANLAGASGTQRKEIQIRINQLTKAIKRAEAVVENLEKVPEKVGGREAPGEFILKK